MNIRMAETNTARLEFTSRANNKITVL